MIVLDLDVQLKNTYLTHIQNGIFYTTQNNFLIEYNYLIHDTNLRQYTIQYLLFYLPLELIMAKSLEKEPMIIPDEYDGLWSAYYVEIIFHKGNKSHKIKLDEGIRGINCKCKVTVDKDGWVYVC